MCGQIKYHIGLFFDVHLVQCLLQTVIAFLLCNLPEHELEFQEQTLELLQNIIRNELRITIVVIVLRTVAFLIR